MDLTFVDDATIRIKQETYRDITAPTDVLSFSQLENTGKEQICGFSRGQGAGDIVISLETGLSRARNTALAETEIAFLTIRLAAPFGL